MPASSLTRAQVRDVDRRAIEVYGLPGIVLMENAGRGATDVLVSQGIAGPVVICAGKGNNGGDGFVIARHLANQGYEPRVLLFAPPEDLRGDAAVNYRVLAAADLAGVVMGDQPDPTLLQEELAPRLRHGPPAGRVRPRSSHGDLRRAKSRLRQAWSGDIHGDRACRRHWCAAQVACGT